MRIESALRRFCAAMLCISSAFVCADEHHACDALSEPGPHTATLLFENDLFGDTDQQYTNGFKLSYLSPNLKGLRAEHGAPNWLLDAVQNLRAFEREAGVRCEREFNIGFALGQLMFTPEDTASRRLLPDDRPYAGWLFGGLTLVSKSRTVADTLDIQVGMVGPASLAEQAQKFVHDLRDLDQPRGWQNQLSNEPGLVIYYERKWRARPAPLFARFGYDVIGHAGLAVGNVWDYGALGFETRLGWNLPNDFGTSLVRPGGDANAPIAQGAGGSYGRGFGAYAFAALGGRLVGRNIFLDGNSFEGSHDVDKKYAVGDFVVGASVLYGPLKLSYAQVFRTREFDGQRRRHNFGSINLSVTF